MREWLAAPPAGEQRLVAVRLHAAALVVEAGGVGAGGAQLLITKLIAQAKAYLARFALGKKADVQVLVAHGALLLIGEKNVGRHEAYLQLVVPQGLLQAHRGRAEGPERNESIHARRVVKARHFQAHALGQAPGGLQVGQGRELALAVVAT